MWGRCLVGLALAGGTRAAPAATADRPVVVTTIFALYDWARVVGGDRVTVRSLLPPGVEAHSFAPRPADVLALNQTRVLIYLGADLEPWARHLVQGVDNPRLCVVEAGRDIARASENGPHTEAEAALPDAHGHTDPHIWLDPVLAQSIVAAIADGLARADPGGRAYYQERAAAYRSQLRALDERIRVALGHCRHRQILYAGHFAFGYFARRYHLTHQAPYAGFSPNAQPTPGQIAALIEAIRASGQTTLFHEELLDPKVGRTISDETGVRLALLHAAHNLSREDWMRGDVTYLSLMEGNLARLRAALDCP